MDTVVTVLTYASFVISGAIVALAAIAPRTKTTVDDRGLTFLTWLHDTLAKVLLPNHNVTPKASAPKE